MFMLLLTGLWRRHVFLIAILVGYLIILVMSVYAQSGRFHVPALPLEIMFAAYCIQLIEQKCPIFPMYMEAKSIRVGSFYGAFLW